jgi:hypothetical protein
VEGARSSLKAWLSSDNGQTFRLHELGAVMGANDVPRLVHQGTRMVAIWRTAIEVHVYELPI